VPAKVGANADVQDGRAQCLLYGISRAAPSALGHIKRQNSVETKVQRDYLKK
jgi:hypothetical protein